MSTNKYILLFIIFFLVMPFKVILGQEAEAEIDTAQESELDIKYDSVLSKAASSLADSAFKEAIDYYKEASGLKPTETYPYKMLKYAETILSEVTAKQKRADDLKRKAQIRDDLYKANEAIVDRNWDSARFYFNEILTLQPEKTDADYAKSKIEAIRLELQRIALRTPVKEEPKPVFVPRNRREARAQRKVEERNAIVAAANKKMQQQPVQTTAPGNSVVIAADHAKEIPQKPVQAALPNKNAPVASSPTETTQKPVQAPLPDKKVTVASPTEILQKPAETPLPNKNPPVASSPPQTTQKPVQAPLPDKKVAVASPTEHYKNQ
ncbi:MAG: hypothetical protein WKG06_32135 [Segetibacter sp.]